MGIFTLAGCFPNLGEEESTGKMTIDTYSVVMIGATPVLRFKGKCAPKTTRLFIGIDTSSYQGFTQGGNNSLPSEGGAYGKCNSNGKYTAFYHVPNPSIPRNFVLKLKGQTRDGRLTRPASKNIIYNPNLGGVVGFAVVAGGGNDVTGSLRLKYSIGQPVSGYDVNGSAIRLRSNFQGAVE